MAWIVKNISNNVVILSDLNIVLYQNQTRDLDLLDRTLVEKSRDVKEALASGLIEEVRKDAPGATAERFAQEAFDQMQETTKQAVVAAEKATKAVEKQEETIQVQQDVIENQEKAIEAYKEEQKENRSILEEMRDMLSAYPEEIRAMKTAIENAQTERVVISEQRAGLKTSDLTDEEIALQEKILKNRDDKLEKNISNMGETLKVDDASLQDSLDALDSLGLE
jgi:predicted ribosome quality control (RQC) complex YloA/Tae2 family protein